MFGAAMLGIAAAIVLMTTFQEVKGPWLSREGIAIAVPLLALGAGVLLCLRWLTNHFYLIDRARQAVYFHSQFLHIRRVRLLLERKDIHAMAVESRHQQSNRSRWWEHRAVLVDVRGQAVPLGNWERDILPAANNLARDLATKLGCAWHESPEECRLVVRNEYGRPTITYVPYPLTPPMVKQLAVVVVVAILAFIVLAALILFA